MPNDIDVISHKLGEISSTLAHIRETQAAQGKKLDQVDKRTADLEVRAATAGGVGGTIASLAVAMITWQLKGPLGGS